ncbi:cysteine-rich repeat secretory protein 55-like [Wolffia australiana]
MASVSSSFLCLLLFLVFIPHPNCEAAEPLARLCNPDRPTTPAVATNIAKLLSSLQSNAPSQRFFSTSVGAGNSKVYGLAQCRRDVSSADCATCVQDAARQLPSLCPGQADARVWFDTCFVRYDTRAFAGQLDTGYVTFYISVENVSDNAAEQQRFNRELGSLMSKVQKQASAKGSLGLAKRQTKFTPFVTLYALAQCTQDLPSLACAQCISTAVANFPVFCPVRKGCRALYSSCYVRYEIYPFFFPMASTANTLPRATSLSVPLVISP